MYKGRKSVDYKSNLHIAVRDRGQQADENKTS